MHNSAAPLWRIARELRARPIALESSAFAAIDRQLDAAIAARLAGTVQPRAEASDVRPADDEPEKPYEVNDGVATVKLYGVVGRHLSALDMECGGCDVDYVARALAGADADPEVRAIVLDVDSPGGSVAGVSSCAILIRNLSKPCVAYADDLCCSAAYWIASQAKAFIVGPTAEVGSVGVYCAVLDESVRYERNGLRVDVVASGPHKGAGVAGTSLTDDQRSALQADVDYLASLFAADVRRIRSAIDPAILDGRSMRGQLAVDASLADAVADIGAARAVALDLATRRRT